MKNKSALLTDLVFPNKYSKWRNVEILNFIEEFDTDILVFKIDDFCGIFYEFDWDFINQTKTLEDYNILIFDKKFNNIDKYNKKIDGKIFNNKFNASYLITKKDYFDINNYDFIYHIFLMNYISFNKNFNFDYKKQFIHLYPGGGFFENNLEIHNDTNVISTNPLTTIKLNQKLHKNYIDVWTGTLMKKNDCFFEKNLKTTNELNICFSSMGNLKEKGFDLYENLIEEYKKKFAYDNINFYSVGSSITTPSNNLIKNLNVMNYLELDNFYKENIDVYITLSRNTAFNGWPIGLESLIQGCVLITTDPNDISKYYNLNKENGIFIVKNEIECIQILKNLYENKNLLNTNSKLSQENFAKYLTYENHQKKIFDFIKEKT